MARGIRHNVPETKSVQTWANDLIGVVATIMETWATNFKMTRREALRNESLSYQEVGAELLEIWTTVYAQKPSAKQVKGGFLALHGEEADSTVAVKEEAHIQDSTQVELPHSHPQSQGTSNGRHKGQGRKEKHGRGNKRQRVNSGDSSTKCKACLQFHDLKDCFYVFLNKRPKSFNPSYIIQALADARVKADPELEKEIKRLLEKMQFLNFRWAPPADCVYAGDVTVSIQGYGDVDIQINGPDGERIMRLIDVAFCENFACNLVSLRQLRKKGYYWDNRPPNNCLRRKDGSVVCELKDKFGQFIIEDIPWDVTKAAFGIRRNRFNSWTERPPSAASERVWHLRLGHPGPEVLNHLPGHSKGVRVKGTTSVECDACGRSKAKRKIRRQTREKPSRPGQRIAVDFLDLEPDSEGFWSAMLCTDRYSGYVFDVYLKRRTADALVEAFKYLLGVLANQYHIKPEVLECDNEIVKAEALESFLRQEQHIRIEPSAPHTQAQNGGAERSGGVIKEKARAMRMGAKLPSFLWVETYKAAVYLHNRTPKYQLFWQSPYETFYTYLAYRDGIVVQDRKPQQAHLRAYGCKAFAMSADALEKRKRLQKLNPKAWIGYLVGYNSTNIYRIWNPMTNEVMAVRDVAFNETEFFTGDIKDLKDDLLRVTEEEMASLIREVRLTDQSLQNPGATMQEEDEELSGIHQMHAGQEVEHHGGIDANIQSVIDVNVCTGGPDHPYSTAQFEPLLTPDATPPPAVALMTAAFSGLTDLSDGVEHGVPPGQEEAESTRSLYVLPDNRAIRRRYGVWEAAFNAGRLATPVGTYNGERVTKRRLHKLVDKPSARTEGSKFNRLDPGGLSTFVPRQPGRIHRRDLPPPPKSHRDLVGSKNREKHPIAEGFLEAERIHLQSHREMQSWIEIDQTKAKDHQVLGCMWVYVYKFDKHGWLVKCKARLVVRSNQQAKTVLENTYALILAGCLF
ncbi:hypothetical protein O1611_g4017 [Lasiodiplodia mahajangana]|uniref:Uncharacterized protein n=1 Tax=Lasiodiplodia mahajangana TaxID=1108764 RepID=A0ACC2JQP3_9PEZI|nr:hypothetical protein O1611_g4017 [Lasiodiplodia mahajangana]